MYVKASNFHNKKNLSGHENIDTDRSPYSTGYVENEFQTKYACTREEFAQRILCELKDAAKVYKRKSKKESEDTFPFGKYEGQKCSDVRDTAYVAWLYFHSRNRPDVVKLIVENYEPSSISASLFRRKYV